MKLNSRPALLACTLPLLMATLPSCTRAHYTPAPSSQAGASSSASVTALDGYWLEESVPAELAINYHNGHASKPTSVYIKNGQIFNVFRYSDGTVDTIDSGITLPSTADINGNWVTTGIDYSETVHGGGKSFAIHEVLNSSSNPTNIDLVYTKIDLPTAGLHARTLWFTKTSAYGFANQYCSTKNKLDPATSAMVGQINQFVANDLKANGTSMAQIQALRNAKGASLSTCQIAEDYLERGRAFAETGVVPPNPDLTEMPTLSISIDSNSNLAPVQALQIDSLIISSDDNGKSQIDLTPLATISGLEALTLENTQVTGLEKLSSLSNFEDLTLINTDLSDYSELKQLPELAGLNIQNSSISKALTTIPMLSQLDNLTLNGGNHASQKLDLTAIGGLSNLLTLGLSGNYINLNFLPKLGHLLNLNLTLENDDPVAMIGSLSTVGSLKRISLTKTVNNPDDLSFISKISNIIKLTLNLGSKMSDLTIISSQMTPVLQALSINGSSNEQLPSLKNAMTVSSLSSITVSNLTISDLSSFEGFLNANSYNTLTLSSDQVPSSQKSEDQNLRKEFSDRYSSNLTFN